MVHYFFRPLLLSCIALCSVCSSYAQNLDYYKILSITRSIAYGDRGSYSQYMYTMDSTKIVRTKITSNNGKTNQTIDTSAIELTYWKELNKYTDLDYFFELPNKIGCPGCTDGGIEYIEIVTPYKKHLVIFESYNSLGMNSFLERLPDMH